MSEMAMSLTSMVKAIKKKRVPKMPKVPTPPPQLPQDPLERAIIKLEADSAFSNNEMMDVTDVFMADHNIARVYATLQTSQAQTSLVQHHLEKMHEGSVQS